MEALVTRGLGDRALAVRVFPRDPVEPRDVDNFQYGLKRQDILVGAQMQLVVRTLCPACTACIARVFTSTLRPALYCTYVHVDSPLCLYCKYWHVDPLFGLYCKYVHVEPLPGLYCNYVHVDALFGLCCTYYHADPLSGFVPHVGFLYLLCSPVRSSLYSLCTACTACVFVDPPACTTHVHVSSVSCQALSSLIQPVCCFYLLHASCLLYYCHSLIHLSFCCALPFARHTNSPHAQHD